MRQVKLTEKNINESAFELAIVSYQGVNQAIQSCRFHEPYADRFPLEM